jgi:predicted alpha/beta superfamily hydrolase
MVKTLFTVAFLFIFNSTVFCQPNALPKVKSGKIIRHDKFPSRFVTARNIDVWLPEGYDPAKRYPVLYMHDGQMLFDASITWNKQEWGVDETAAKLIAIKRIAPIIVVGVWNAVAERHIDYFPQKPFESLTAAQMDSIYAASRNSGQALFRGKVQSDKYLQFLVTELKPFIDKTYPTYNDPLNTFIAGSSMGGLISLYAICEYPQVFGGAACLSTHWPGIFSAENNPVPQAFFNYMQAKLPDPATHKIYFDYGDSTLDAMYPPFQKKADAIMKAKNYDARSWTTQFFPGEDHSEQAWNRRLDIPLVFLIGKK